MTPDERRQAWWREMAERLSPVYTQCDDETWLCSPTITVEEAARLAAHFGRLALGETGKTEMTGNDRPISQDRRNGQEVTGND